MLQKRYGHGICLIYNYIYAVGGVENSDDPIRHCERYNILSDSWEIIPELEKACFSMTLMPMSNRYIYMFGGIEGPEQLVQKKEIVQRLDTYALNKGTKYKSAAWERF